MARIISIVNQKGGTGKSACAANLGAGLARKNKKVLIVDADPQSDVSASFGYRDCDDSDQTLTALMEISLRDQNYLPIKGLQQLLKTIGKVRRQINPTLQISGILFSLVNARTKDARDNMDLLHNVYGSQLRIFESYIPFSVRMKEAVREGESIFKYEPGGNVALAFEKLTEEVLADVK